MTPPELQSPSEREAEDEGSEDSNWVEHYKKTITVWGVGILLLALIAGGAAYLFGRSTVPVADPSPTQTAASPSASESPEPPATEASLITEEDAETIVPGASWAVAETETDPAQFQGQAVCMKPDTSNINPLVSLQRTLGTSQDDKLAAMHQIDSYASVDAASTVMAERTANAASCLDVPTYIHRARIIEGLGDEALYMVYSYQNDPVEYHSLLLVRSGKTLTMFDIVRHSSPVMPEDVMAGITRSLDDVCQLSEGACPTEPKFVDIPPPATDPAGWLTPSDLPRITQGAGLWTASAPGPVTIKGTGCENIPLASEAGPSERQQATYIITQDPETPGGFGLDEVVFSFGDAEGAAEFRDKLTTNISGCEDRQMTAEVDEIDEVTAAGQDGTPIEATLYTVSQATSDSESVTFQLIVGSSGNRVFYMLVTTTDDYKFADDALKTLAVRTGQRASQFE